MCGRYYIASEDASEEMRALIDELNRRIREQGLDENAKTGEIYPSDTTLVIANNRARARRPFLMRWGFQPANGTKNLIINARSETVREKRMFIPLLEKSRCVIPATHYFEWEKRDGRRVKYAIRRASGLTLMAGLYRMNPETGRADFVILTRDAAPEIEFIHNRMPLVMNEEAMDMWLNTAADPMAALRIPPPPLAAAAQS